MKILNVSEKCLKTLFSKKLILYVSIFILLSAVALASGDQSSVCFDYSGDGTYFLYNSELGYHSEVIVTDLGTQTKIEITLDSLAKPYLSWGEKDSDNDGNVEPDELKSDGLWIALDGTPTYEWVVDGTKDSEIVVDGYPSDLEKKPLKYTANITEPSSGQEICLDIHHSPNGEDCLLTDCKGLNSISVNFNYTFSEDDSVKVEVIGAGKTKLKDSETATVSSSNVNNSIGQHDLIIDELNTSGIWMTINSVSVSDSKGNFKDKIAPEIEIKVYLNDQLIASATDHTSCSEPIEIGDNFDGDDGGLYTITDLDKIFKGELTDENDNGIADICEEEELDFGDAPDPNYPTLLANNGARHIAIGPLLGQLRDTEPDGQPTANADGDDLANQDDEDGVTFTSFLVQGNNGSVQVIASAVCKLDAWIDFNQNGVFDHPSEQIFTSQPLVAGVNNLLFQIPINAVLEDTFARFRCSTPGGLTPQGLAIDGEVEDYKVDIDECDTDEDCLPGFICGPGRACTQIQVPEFTTIGILVAIAVIIGLYFFRRHKTQIQ